ncbi:MAG: VCBS repeat-containing protein [Verrucomicrobia bacterium]|nr:VCBS repeat-containing protein [Verrucomicrobiota bacterium]
MSCQSGLAQDRGDPWPVHVIDSGLSGGDGVRLMDVDNDGDQDLAVGWEQGGATRMYLNPGPNSKVKEKWPSIDVGVTPDVEDAMFADVDGDGRVDVVSCSEGDHQRIEVHFAPTEKDYAASSGWKTIEFPQSLTGKRRWMFAIALDVNEDGHLDLVVGGKSGDAKVAWLEAPTSNKRNLSLWKFHEMSNAGWIMSVIAQDMDGDGDEDILLSDRRPNSVGTGVRWLENPGVGTRQLGYWVSHFVSDVGDLPDFIDLADMDGDGDLDVIASCKVPDRIDWHERLDESGLRWKEHEISFPENMGHSKAVKVRDINLDGKLDIVVSCSSAEAPLSGMVWMEYPKSVFDRDWIAHEISGPDGSKYDRLELIDLDGDGDLDVMTTEENFGPKSLGLGAIWYENPTKQSFKLMAIKRESERRAIINNLRQLASAADQYLLEHGVTEVAVEDLVGGDKFIRELEPVAGESYQGFVISQGTALTVTDSSGVVYQLDF